MSSKIINYTGITRLDIDPDRILDSAQGQLEGVVILGYTRDGDEYFASSYADGGTVLWMLERCKTALLGVRPAEE
jgi:hypothetical protein